MKLLNNIQLNEETLVLKRAESKKKFESLLIYVEKALNTTIISADGLYRIIPNIASSLVNKSASLVTLVMHSTLNHLNKTLMLMKIWHGPMSITIFAPGLEFEKALNKVIKFYKCNQIQLQNLTIHMVTNFPNNNDRVSFNRSAYNSVNFSHNVKERKNFISYAQRGFAYLIIYYRMLA
jgi:hypothetical protein